jgi:hypothetical protein
MTTPWQSATQYSNGKITVQSIGVQGYIARSRGLPIPPPLFTSFLLVNLFQGYERIRKLTSEKELYKQSYFLQQLLKIY